MFSHEQVRLHSLNIFPPARQINKNPGHTIGYLFYLVTCSRLSYVESWLLRNAFLGNLVLEEINVLHIQETAGVGSVVEWNTSGFDVGTFLQLFNKWTDSLVLNELIKNCNFLFFVSDGKQQGVPKLIIPATGVGFSKRCYGNAIKRNLKNECTPFWLVLRVLRNIRR